MSGELDGCICWSVVGGMGLGSSVRGLCVVVWGVKRFRYDFLVSWSAPCRLVWLDGVR